MEAEAEFLKGAEVTPGLFFVRALLIMDDLLEQPQPTPAFVEIERIGQGRQVLLIGPQAMDQSRTFRIEDIENSGDDRIPLGIDEAVVLQTAVSELTKRSLDVILRNQLECLQQQGFHVGHFRRICQP